MVDFWRCNAVGIALIPKEFAETNNRPPTNPNHRVFVACFFMFIMLEHKRRLVAASLGQDHRAEGRF